MRERVCGFFYGVAAVAMFVGLCGGLFARECLWLLGGGVSLGGCTVAIDELTRKVRDQKW